MRLRDLAEATHNYDNPDWKTQFQPVKIGDSFRVFHGFRMFSDAVITARHGLSGKEYADRAYSFETDNNPKGLFITLSFKIAADFVGAYDEQCVMEFVCTLDELEPPVWPGGSYTVQGQMAQYFGHGAKGRAGRRQRARDAEQEVAQQIAQRPDDLQHVQQSDKKYLAYLLTNSREHQALFVGDLPPERITAFYIRPNGSLITAPWEKLTREQFLQRYVERKAEVKTNRMFGPAEDFDGDEFMRRLIDRFGRDDPEWIWKVVGDQFQQAIESKRPTEAFLSVFGHYLWPRQYRPAFLWMRRRFGKRP